jgi:hypothetical protein
VVVVVQATVAFEARFEECGTCEESQRIAYAKAVLAAYGSDSVDGGTGDDGGTTGDAGGTPCFVSSLGTSGACMPTSACAALGNVSTPGYCPGPDDDCESQSPRPALQLIEQRRICPGDHEIDRAHVDSPEQLLLARF